jgi:hypothetical protein
MLRSKKFIIVSAILAVVLVVGIAGVAIAQTGGETQSGGKTLLGRVAAILNLDEQTVEDAFQQAKKEMADEALDARLNALVEKGTITQGQADEYKEWWQGRPDTLAPAIRGFGRFGMRGFAPGMGRCFPALKGEVPAITQ